MTVGDFAVIYTTLARPPKVKLTICICTAPALFLWINTEARHHGVAQMPLAANDYPEALKHDCFLDGVYPFDVRTTTAS